VEVGQDGDQGAAGRGSAGEQAQGLAAQPRICRGRLHVCAQVGEQGVRVEVAGDGGVAAAGQGEQLEVGEGAQRGGVGEHSQDARALRVVVGRIVAMSQGRALREGQAVAEVSRPRVVDAELAQDGERGRCAGEQAGAGQPSLAARLS
jgi:hypothetical protein